MVSSRRVWWRQAEAARAFGMARQIVVVTDIQDSSSETGAHSLRDESAGLGFLIDDARWQLRPDIMICGMITIAMIGWVSENWFFDWVEEKTLVRGGMRTA